MISNSLTIKIDNELIKKLSGFFFILFFVYLSLPVTAMGGKSIFYNIFTQKETNFYNADISCLEENNACFLEFQNGINTSVAMPAQVSSIYPFDITVSFENENVDSITVTFEGVEHSHGLRPLLLDKINSHKFQAEGLLGYCGFGKMNWIGRITATTDQNIYEISLPFQSVDL